MISAVFFRDFLPMPVYASLVPIIAGVSLASLRWKPCAACNAREIATPTEVPNATNCSPIEAVWSSDGAAIPMDNLSPPPTFSANQIRT